MIEDGLYSYLSAQTNLTDLIGEGVNVGLFPNYLPVGASLPLVTYNRMGSSHGKFLNGAIGQAEARFQLDCYASDDTGYSAVKNIADVLRLKLDGYRGWMGTTFVNDCEISNQTDFYDPPQHAGDFGTHRVSLDVTIVYQETRPSFV